MEPALAIDRTMNASAAKQSEMLRLLGVPEAVLAQAWDSASRSGRSLMDVLRTTSGVDRAVLVEASHKLGIPYRASRMTDIPPHDRTLPAGEALVLVEKVLHDNAPPRFFVVVPEGRDVSVGSSAAAIGFRERARFAGLIEVPQNLMDVLAGKGSRAEISKNDAELHRAFDELAQRALRERASDIHISLLEGHGSVWFRIDGELEHVHDWSEEYVISFCTSVYNTLVEHGSTQTGFSMIDRQDGAIVRHYPEGMVRFRYASTPTAPDGFDVVMRLIPLGAQASYRTMQSLGYSDDQVDDLDRMFGRSSGLIFFLGTTGSGKSTSMAVALENLARERPGKVIRTVEQPVEYRIWGAHQSSVSKEEFLPAISQMMRLDPDYLMVGEVRDPESAQAVLQAARSGHLCVTTLHADGAPLAYDRLHGLGVPRQDLASVGLVAGIVYQKLIQVLCPYCKVPAVEYAKKHPDAGVVRRLLKITDGNLIGIYFGSGTGCPHCRNGVKGRTVCAEILRPTPDMMEAIKTADSRKLWQRWRAKIDHAHPEVMRGRTSFEHALWKMRQGLVAPDAVEREFRYLDENPFDEEAA